MPEMPIDCALTMRFILLTSRQAVVKHRLFEETDAQSISYRHHYLPAALRISVKKKKKKNQCVLCHCFLSTMIIINFLKKLTQLHLASDEHVVCSVLSL